MAQVVDMPEILAGNGMSEKAFKYFSDNTAAIAAHGDLQQHSKHDAQRQTPGSGTGVGAALVDHD
eukprot:CAMPEP_0203894826 /NCGR_PEP_ID=MMETSP0359-20131031/37734_1 /ASSEMBLY_ACC=CAM_ASM_000338 /TAXON_ID=268821 /ORGANISM="Scrippsiella Hangoei, Strain SHTV-5" /LENGTH=64 /DNA_ID=CAMNT_0050817205 /DNA_START=271 /DNA_END=464 /DNA_ORIENTATION=-